MSDVKKIVLIDDEEDLCSVVKENLEESGKFQVQTLSDPSQALEFVRAQSPDLSVRICSGTVPRFDFT